MTWVRRIVHHDVPDPSTLEATIMCGRYLLRTPLSEIAKYFNVLRDFVDCGPNYNIAPGSMIPVLFEGRDGHLAIAPMRWGLIPSWSRGPDPRFSTINARVETIAEKPSWRRAIEARRCIIPADGYYEWRTFRTGPGEKPRKQPYVVTLPDEAGNAGELPQLMLLAGVYDVWTDPDGHRIPSVAILTAPALPSIRALHDRMPVLVTRSNVRPWLDRGQGGRVLESVLGGLGTMRFDVRPVHQRVGNPRNNGPDCLEPVEAPGISGDARPGSAIV